MEVLLAAGLMGSAGKGEGGAAFAWFIVAVWGDLQVCF